MERNYTFRLRDNDPELSIALPVGMINDICERAEENGHSFSVEIMLRMARTLERDRQREEFDRFLKEISSLGA